MKLNHNHPNCCTNRHVLLFLDSFLCSFTVLRALVLLTWTGTRSSSQTCTALLAVPMRKPLCLADIYADNVVVHCYFSRRKSGYVSCSLFLGYDIQYLKWLEMQRHALSSIQLNQQNYQAPYSVCRNSLSQFQASSSSHVRMPICTPGSSNTINDDESLRMPTKVSYGTNNLLSRIIKYGESSKLQDNREPEEDLMTDESSEPTGDSGESQKEQETPQFQWTKKQVSKLLELYADEKLSARFRDKITKKKQVWSDLAAALNKD